MIIDPLERNCMTTQNHVSCAFHLKSNAQQIRQIHNQKYQKIHYFGRFPTMTRIWQYLYHHQVFIHECHVQLIGFHCFIYVPVFPCILSCRFFRPKTQRNDTMCTFTTIHTVTVKGKADEFSICKWFANYFCRFLHILFADSEYL